MKIRNYLNSLDEKEARIAEHEVKQCPMYAIGRAEELPGIDAVICSVELCPYNNLQIFHPEGDPVPICKTKGLVKITESNFIN